MLLRYVVHQHKSGKSHFDLRICQDGVLRSWSLLREPPLRSGERRLAIERESQPVEILQQTSVEEEAFGRGRIFIWDEGEVEILESSSKRMLMSFRGHKLSGKHEMRLMGWYPGNRWIMEKTGRKKRNS